MTIITQLNADLLIGKKLNPSLPRLMAWMMKTIKLILPDRRMNCCLELRYSSFSNTRILLPFRNRMIECTMNMMIGQMYIVDMARNLKVKLGLKLMPQYSNRLG